MNATPEKEPVETIRAREILGLAMPPLIEAVPAIFAALAKSDKRRASVSFNVRVSGTTEQPAYECTVSVPQTTKLKTDRKPGRNLNQPSLPDME